MEETTNEKGLSKWQTIGIVAYLIGSVGVALYGKAHFEKNVSKNSDAELSTRPFIVRKEKVDLDLDGKEDFYGVTKDGREIVHINEKDGRGHYVFSTMGPDNFFKIDKINGINYDVWRATIENSLEEVRAR